MHGSSRCARKCLCTGPCRALTPAQHAVAGVFVREGTGHGYSKGVLHACPLRARATTGAPAVPQCAHTVYGTCTHTRKVPSDSHAPTRAARVRARRWKWHLRGARTHGLTKRTERVRTYHGTHGTAAPIGYYPFSQRARKVLGGDSRAYGNRVRWGAVRARAAARRLGYGTRRVVGTWSVFLTTRRVLAGYLRRTHGPVRGMTCAGQWNGPCGALATSTYRARAREGILRTIPSTPRRRAAARGCCQRTQSHVRRGHAHGSPTVRAGARRGAYGHQRASARSHAHGAASRAAGAQDTQLIERRQRGGDRAVERVRAVRPATCMVRPAVP